MAHVASADMRNLRRLLRALLWLTGGGLVSFCLTFGIPFLASIPAKKVLEWAGCRPPGFDQQAVCPAGSFAEPFIPLSNWFTSMFAPLVLIANFGVYLLIGLGICLIFWLSCTYLDKIAGEEVVRSGKPPYEE